ncbi:MAG TPA: MBL fold metallo-hydrolase [Ilumatobacter sp.]|nr:MBL fold metallo-hydrolase [Ilumatobacter sp.]
MLTFLGGAGSVTGSRFLIETPDARVLVDCGLFQGLKELRLRNWAPFPLDPASIDAVVITHSHIDHVGYLPRLCCEGFGGRVACTDGTAQLAAIVLPDSGHLQEEEAEYANRVGFSKHHPALPLYTEADAVRALEQIDAHPFDEWVDLAPGIQVQFRPAGHILGSATATIRLAETGRTVVFSGDLGRPNHPLLVPPAPPEGADVVVMESTYGGRLHDDAESLTQLRDAVTRTASRGGTVLIPAFAVDRTEVILFHLRELMQAGEIPRLSVYVDSPMALRALGVYRDAISSGAADVQPEWHDHEDPFDTGHLIEVRDVQDSKAIADVSFPMIVVSASGMATGGRVLHHLARMLPDRRNTIIMVGFQAAGTRGRALADGLSEIKMFGTYERVRAEVVDIPGFSVHADHDELVRWLGSATTEPDTTYLVHGEPGASAALHDAIEDTLDWKAVVPDHLERVQLV